MKVLRIYNQMRRDCWADLECENCGYKATDKYAYDDRYYWENVIPDGTCPECKKSTNDLDIRIKQKIETKYPNGFHI